MIAENISAMQAVFAVLCGLAALCVIIANGYIFVKGCIFKAHCPSCFPFLGGIAGALAVLLTVREEWYFLAVVPMFIDWGCIPLIVRFVYLFVSDDLKSRRGQGCYLAYFDVEYI